MAISHRFQVVTLLLALSGCSMTMENARQPENKTTFAFDKDYQVVYRIVMENSRRCAEATSIYGSVFADTRKAFIDYSPQSHVVYTMDLESTGEGKTRLDLYTQFSVQTKLLSLRLPAWINDGKTNCRFDGIPIFGPD